jgi:hypothetical protein
MTIDHFRRIALSMPGAEELNGLGYPNFRAGRKSFATIEGSTAVIRLTRDQQATFVAAGPEMFAPASGGWGRLGSTIVRLEAADEARLRDALATAWRNVTNLAADAVKTSGAFKVADAAYVVNVAVADINAKVADVDDVDVPDAAAEVANVLANVAHVGTDIADVPAVVADAASIEPRDDLQNVIERLQVYWGQGPAT